MDYRRKGAMLQQIRDCARGRPWIAIAAAYAVALQMVFGGLGVASSAGSADTFSIICQNGGHSGNEDGGGSLPVHQSPCVLCAVAHVSVILNGGHPADAVAGPAVDSDLVPPPRDDLLVAIHVLRGNYARGPPSTDITG